MNLTIHTKNTFAEAMKMYSQLSPASKAGWSFECLSSQEALLMTAQHDPQGVPTDPFVQAVLIAILMLKDYSEAAGGLDSVQVVGVLSRFAASTTADFMEPFEGVPDHLRTFFLDLDVNPDRTLLGKRLHAAMQELEEQGWIGDYKQRSLAPGETPRSARSTRRKPPKGWH